MSVIEGQAEVVNETEIPKEGVSTTVLFDDAMRARLQSAESALTIAAVFDKIEDAEMCQDAVEERNTNLREIDALKAGMKYLIEPFNTGIQRIRGLITPKITAREHAVRLLNIRITDFTDRMRLANEEQKRKQEADARALRQKADEEAAAIRARADAEAAEKKRLADEQEKLQREALARNDAAAAADAAAKKAELDAQAKNVVDAGHRAAEQTHMEATAAGNSPAVLNHLELTGNSSRRKWIAELLPDMTEQDAKLMICEKIGVGDHQLLALLDLNQSALNKLAASLHEHMQVPGFSAKEVRIQAGSRK